VSVMSGWVQIWTDQFDFSKKLNWVEFTSINISSFKGNKIDTNNNHPSSKDIWVRDHHSYSSSWQLTWNSWVCVYIYMYAHYIWVRLWCFAPFILRVRISNLKVQTTDLNRWICSSYWTIFGDQNLYFLKKNYYFLDGYKIASFLWCKNH
jgi:hypothetical protein